MKIEYILNDGECIEKLTAGKNLRDIGLYGNCSNLCGFCENQNIPGDNNCRVFINVTAPYRLLKEAVQVDEFVLGLVGSDPYQAAEEKYCLVKTALEILREKKKPVRIFTKSESILRDLNYLSLLAKEFEIKVFIKISSLSKLFYRSFEKNCIAPVMRLKIMKRLADQGIQTGLAIIPALPEIVSRTDFTALFRNAKQNGAGEVVYRYLKFTNCSRGNILKIIKEKFPDKEKKFLSLYPQEENIAGNQFYSETDAFFSELADFYKLYIKKLED